MKVRNAKPSWQPIEIVLEDPMEVNAILCVLAAITDTQLLHHALDRGHAGNFIVKFRDELFRRISERRPQ